MSRFYVPKENVDLKKNEITISGDEAHHIIDVMRLKEGDRVVVFDGTGVEYTGFIKGDDARSKSVRVGIVKTDKPNITRNLRVTLAQALPKKAKMDAIVEKATELGVQRVTPLVTARTIVRPDDAGRQKKVSRWKRIAAEAAKQCGRAEVPEVRDITRYEDALKELDDHDMVLFAHLYERTVPMKEAVRDLRAGSVIIFIGPEGDFTPDEVERVKEHGNCKFISLGKRVLKSDTAGLFVLAALNYEFSL